MRASLDLIILRIEVVAVVFAKCCLSWVRMHSSHSCAMMHFKCSHESLIMLSVMNYWVFELYPVAFKTTFLKQGWIPVFYLLDGATYFISYSFIFSQHWLLEKVISTLSIYGGIWNEAISNRIGCSDCKMSYSRKNIHLLLCTLAVVQPSIKCNTL